MYLGDWNTSRALAADLVAWVSGEQTWDAIEDEWEALDLPKKDVVLQKIEQVEGESSREVIDSVARWLMDANIPTEDPDHAVDENLSSMNEVRSAADALLDGPLDEPQKYRKGLSSLGFTEPAEVYSIVTEADANYDDNIEAMNHVASQLVKRGYTVPEHSEISEAFEQATVLPEDPHDVLPLGRPDDVDATVAEWDDACEMAADFYDNHVNERGEYGRIQNSYDLPAPRADDVFARFRQLEGRPLESVIRNMAKFILAQRSPEERSRRIMGYGG